VAKGALISSLKMHENHLADLLRELTALLQIPYSWRGREEERGRENDRR